MVMRKLNIRRIIHVCYSDTTAESEVPRRHRWQKCVYTCVVQSGRWRTRKVKHYLGRTEWREKIVGVMRKKPGRIWTIGKSKHRDGWILYSLINLEFSENSCEYSSLCVGRRTFHSLLTKTRTLSSEYLPPDLSNFTWKKETWWATAYRSGRFRRRRTSLFQVFEPDGPTLKISPNIIFAASFALGILSAYRVALFGF